MNPDLRSRVIMVHIVGDGYDTIYSVDNEEDALLVKRILDRLLVLKHSSPQSQP